MWLWRASWIRFFSPLTRLSPPVSTILRTAAGLPSTQLLGASASVINEAKKCARPFSSLFNADCSMKCDSSFCVAEVRLHQRAYRALLFPPDRRSAGPGVRHQLGLPLRDLAQLLHVAAQVRANRRGVLVTALSSEPAALATSRLFKADQRVDRERVAAGLGDEATKIAGRAERRQAGLARAAGQLWRRYRGAARFFATRVAAAVAVWRSCRQRAAPRGRGCGRQRWWRQPSCRRHAWRLPRRWCGRGPRRRCWWPWWVVLRRSAEHHRERGGQRRLVAALDLDRVLERKQPAAAALVIGGGELMRLRTACPPAPALGIAPCRGRS